MSIYGNLNPDKTIKVENSFQAPRKHIRMNYTPSTIDQNQYLENRKGCF